MSNTKQKIISELKSKLTQFKTQLKSHKIKDEQDEKKEDEEIIIKLPLNKNNIEKNNNKENISNNIIMNKQIKSSKLERANSTCASSFGYTKKFLDFDLDKMLIETKRHSNSKSNINIDELNVMPRNKTFINLDLNTKKIFSKTDRKKEMFTLDNLNRINNDYINKYEQNYSEPNVDNNNKITTSNNNIILQNKFYNYSTNDLMPFSKDKKERERFSAKPEIRTDVSRYNLNFMMNINNNNKNVNGKNSDKLFSNINKYKNENNNNNYSMNIKNILNNNIRKTNFNSISGLNNKYLISSHTTYNYNNYNSYNRVNGYNNYNKGNKRKKFLIKLEINKSNNCNLNMSEIHKIKYIIQNLSTDEINNMPISVFKEMKDLYDLIYRKFLKNNLI